MKNMREKEEDLSGKLKFICEQWKWKCYKIDEVTKLEK